MSIQPDDPNKFKVTPPKGGPKAFKPKAAAYDADGNPTKKDAVGCLAKTEGPNCLVRRQSAGGSRLYNPLADNPDELGKTHRTTGRPHWEFARVHRDVFDSYVTFLKTHNTIHLRQAERAL